MSYAADVKQPVSEKPERGVLSEYLAAAELGWYDFLTTYRRSFLGPLWAPLQILAFVAVITLILGRTFENDSGLYAVYVAIGVVIWELLSSALGEGPLFFSRQANLIKSIPVKLSTLVIRKLSYLLYRMVFVFPVALIILLIFGEPLKPVALMSLLAAPVFVVTVFCILVVLGFLGVYMRDLHFFMQSALRFLFFMTPIFWYGDRGMRSMIANSNPFTYYLEIVRQPLMGQYPSLRAWLVVLALSTVGVLLSYYVLNRLKRALVFWL